MCTNIFTKKEVESILKISPDTLDKMLRECKIEYFKLGNRVRISEEQLATYLEACKRTKPNDAEL